MTDEEVMKHPKKEGSVEVQSSGQVSAIGSTGTVNPEVCIPRRPVPPFLETLYKIVTKGRQGIVRWDSEVRSKAQLVIIDKKIFLEEEVPQFTAAIKWDSFKRNLYNYGFRKVGKSAPGDESSMWGHEKLRGQTAHNILLLKRRVTQSFKISPSIAPNDNAIDKKGESEPPLSTLLSPPLECHRNRDADLFSTISSASEISSVGLFTTPTAGSLPSTLMAVPESCNVQLSCDYDLATDDSHIKSMIDPELLSHPVASIRSQSLYIGSKNAVQVVKDEPSTPKTVQFSAKRAQLECMYYDDSMVRTKVVKTTRELENTNCPSALEVTHKFPMLRIRKPKLGIPPTEVTERGMQLITAKDINHILDVSDATSLSTSWRSLGSDGAIRHHLGDMENRTCGTSNTKMEAGHGNSTLPVTETVNVASDTSLTGKNSVRQPFNVSMQYNVR